MRNWFLTLNSALLTIHYSTSLCLADGLAELVGAGGLFPATADAFEAGEDVLDFHAFDESAHALRVAVAAAEEIDVVDDAVFDVEIDLFATSSLCLIGVMHVFKIENVF